MSIHPATKRRLIWSIAAFPLYLGASFLGDARAAGNPFELGIGHGIFFGVFVAAFLYPLFLLIPSVAHAVIRTVRGQNYGPAFSPWEFVGIVAWCILLLSSFLETSDEHYYQRFVSDDVPASLSEFRSVHTSGFGNQRWTVSFRINPADFSKVIGRYAYTKEPSSESMNTLASQAILPLPIATADDIATECYRHVEPALAEACM